MKQIFQDLVERILRDAPNVEIRSGNSLYDSYVKLGHAYLRHSIPYTYLNVDTNVGSKNWDVAAGALIVVELDYTGSHGRPGRGANLWYGRLLANDDFRW
jgi:hypothetical protein